MYGVLWSILFPWFEYEEGVGLASADEECWEFLIETLEQG